MTQFYVTLPSNSLSSRKNNTSEFRVNLSRTLEFSGHWEVGLASIQYPFTWENFPADKFWFSIPKAGDYTVNVPPGNYQHVQQLLDVLLSSFHVSLL